MYNIIRIYRPDLNKQSRLIKRGLTLEQAQKHCGDPKTATSLYFDAYERQ
jgi:hypothetical protein